MFDDNINAQRRELIRLNNMLSVGSEVGWYIETYLDKKSYRDSTLSGNAYANKLLSGHLEHFRQVRRMKRPIFMKLCDVIRCKNLLSDTRDVTLKEQLIMFLFTIINNTVNRLVQEHFQHSSETISHNFNGVIQTIISLSTQYIHDPSSYIPLEFENDTHFVSFFSR